MKIASSVVVERTVVPSVTIKISREDLWFRFMKSVADILWTSEVSDGFIKTDVFQVAKTLTGPASGIHDYDTRVCDLFEFYTVFLLGDLMKEIDNDSVKHYEIIVIDDVAAPVVVESYKINF